MPDDMSTSAPSDHLPSAASGVASNGPPGYELLDEIGRGGMGIVYRARDIGLGRNVAVKLLASRFSPDSAAARRFLGEARISGQLQHPGIPAVHQVGWLPEGQPFLAMKLIEGQTLEATLRDRPTPSTDRDRLLAVFEGVCQAVGYAHSRRVIHRDLKPANVMVGPFGEVQVMDWGLAKVLGEPGAVSEEEPSDPEATRAWNEVVATPQSDDQTQAGSLLGTPAYIPPEQAVGELARVNERSDVFGLGAVLAVILTGKPPYAGARFEEVRLQSIRGNLSDCHARLDTCGAEPELISLCRRCLAFEPADRPQNAGEVARELAGLRLAAAERARNAEREKAAAEARSEEQRRKRIWQLTAAGVVVLALAGGLGGLAAFLQAQRQANSELKTTNSNLGLANEREKQARDELDAALYLNRIALAHRELAESSLLKAEILLDQCPVERRSWEWRYLKRLCHSEPVIIRGQNDIAPAVALSPDGRRLASLAENNTLRISDMATGERLTSLQVPATVACSAFRPPQGRFLFTGDKNGLMVWDTETGKEVGRFGNRVSRVHCMGFSPDGRWLATAEGNKVSLWNAANGDLLHELADHALSVNSLAFSRDGKLIATGCYDTTLKIWDVSTGKSIYTLRGHKGPISGTDFSPDGQRLASASLDGSVKLWNVATGQESLELNGHTMELNGVAFLEDTRIASSSEDRTVKIWDLATGQVVLTLSGHKHELAGIVRSPDGQRLATVSGDKTIRLWDASPLAGRVTEESGVLTGHRERVLDLAYSPDGRRLASASADATARLWDTTTGEEKLSLNNHLRVVFTVAFSPDGNHIATGSAQLAEGEPGCVRLWDASTGREIRQPKSGTVAATALAFSPGDGQWLTAGTEGRRIPVWNASTGERIHTLEQSPNVWGIAFSRDGKRLATLSRGGVVNIYDTTLWGGKPPLSFRAHPISMRDNLAFSPDGRLLAVPGLDNTINVWDVSDPDKPPTAPRLTFRGHKAQVWGVAFSPDGRWIASASEDTTVKLWDAQNGGDAIRTFHGHTSVVSRVAFHPNGKQLASCSFDKTIRLWDLTIINKRRTE